MIKKILSVSQKENLFSDDEKDINEYGYALIKGALLNIIAAITIAMILKKIKVFFLFSMLFIPLRKFAGGFHFNKPIVCYIMSNVMLTCVYYLYELIANVNVYTISVSLILVIEGYIIIKLSPVDSDYKLLEDIEKKRYRNIVIIILIIELMMQYAMIHVINNILLIVWSLELLFLALGKVIKFSRSRVK